ncbi:MAG: CotH kinase family protein, partial [Chitinophagales bacterium]
QTKQNPDKIILSDGSGSILDSLTIELTQTHHSRTRTTDGSTTWTICADPTPGESNDGTEQYTSYADRPTFSVSGGFFSGTVSVDITTIEPDAEIRYTTNGNLPTESSPLYTGTLNLNETAVLKARVFSSNPDIYPGLLMFQTFFIDEPVSTLPIVSIAGNDLQTLANGDDDIEPIASIEIFDTAGDSRTRSYGEMNSHGQDSWANDQRSLDWISRDEFGYSRHLKEKFFVTSERDEFQRMIFRAAGDDNYPAAHHSANEGSAHMRDDYVQTIANNDGLVLDVRRSSRCLVYLNGEYWGVYSFREKTDDHDYTEYYYDQGKYDIQYQMTWGNTWSEYGGSQTMEDWDDLHEFIEDEDMSVEENFNYAASQLDFYSLVDYFVANTTPVTTDWLIYNTAVWRGFNPDGGHQKWGYTLWDNDATFGFYINYSGVPNTGTDATPCDIDEYDPAWFPPSFFDGEGHVRILNALRENPTFEQFYLSRYADLFNTTYSCENMLFTLDSMMNVIEPEMDRHADRWYGTYEEWHDNFMELREFIEERCEILDVGLSDCYELTGPYNVVFKVEPEEAGYLLVNTLTHYDLPWEGEYFGGMENLLTAYANDPSYFFWYWTSNSGTFTDIYDSVSAVSLTAPDTITAHFGLSDFTGIQGENVVQANVNVSPTLFTDAIDVYYHLAQQADVSVNLYDMLGEKVIEYLVSNSDATQGNHKITLDVSAFDLAPGMYVVDFKAGNFRKGFKVSTL